MTFVKVLGALMVLLIGSSSFSFQATDTLAEYLNQGEELILEIDKSSFFFYESGLTAPHYLQKTLFTKYDSKYFRFGSSSKESKAEQYMRFSIFIDPALDVRGVIFPYHSFL